MISHHLYDICAHRTPHSLGYTKNLKMAKIGRNMWFLYIVHTVQQISCVLTANCTLYILNLYCYLKPMIKYCIHSIIAFDPILSQLKPVYNTDTILVIRILILCSLVSFPLFRFLDWTFVRIAPVSIPDSYPTNVIKTEFITLIIVVVQNTVLPYRSSHTVVSSLSCPYIFYSFFSPDAFSSFTFLISAVSRSQWPRGLRYRSCGCSLAGTAGSIPSWTIYVFLLWVLSVVW